MTARSVSRTAACWAVTAVAVFVVPAHAITSSPTWTNTPLAGQTGTFTAEFDAVPTAANMDGVTGLSPTAAGGFGNCAILVRFNDQGRIDVRNGSAYAANTAVAYSPGTNYHFRVVVNVPAHTYSVYVTPAGGAEQTLATSYLFRSEQVTATSLANLALIAEPGSHSVNNFRIVPPVSGQTSTPNWQNNPIYAQSGSFTAEFDTIPNTAGMDGVTALSSSAISGYSNCAVAIRFNSTGTIDARNGSAYAASSITYSVGKSYHVRLAVNVPAHTYSVYVTPAGGTEQTLGTSYAFRTEQASVASLANWGLIAEPGTHSVSNFRIAAAPLAVSAGPDKSVTLGQSTSLAGSCSGGTAPYSYTWSPSSGLNSVTVAQPTATPSVTTTYTLTVRDAAGITASDSVAVAVSAATTPLTASAGTDKSISAGQTTSLAGTASGGLAPYTYSWSPTTALGTPTSATTTAAPASTQTYTLTVRDAAGQTATDSLTVTVATVSTSTYYVATSGNDANAGTAAAPWRTLTKAANTAQAGALVIVKAGTYTETLRPAYSGQAGRLITFKSETPRGAIIDGQRSRAYGVNLSSRTYIRVDGFDIRYHTSAGVYVQAYSGTTAQGMEIANNYIHHSGDYTGWSGSSGQGIEAPNLRNSLIEGNEIYYNGDTAIRLGGSGFQEANVTIRRNVIHYNGRDGIDGGGTNIVVEYNYMYDNEHTATHQDCFQLWQANGWIIRYNTLGDFTQLVYGGMNAGSTGNFVNLQVYGNVLYNSLRWQRRRYNVAAVWIDCRGSNQGNKFQNIQIHSNTFLFLGDSYQAPIQLQGAAGLQMSDVRIYNNIFYQCGAGTGTADAYWIDSRFTNVQANYNCFYGVRANRSGQDLNSITANPLFVNYTQGSASFDVRLQSTSPCINKGAALGSLVTMPGTYFDIDGKTRPLGGAFDIGAYEKQ